MNREVKCGTDDYYGQEAIERQISTVLRWVLRISIVCYNTLYVCNALRTTT